MFAKVSIRIIQTTRHIAVSEQPISVISTPYFGITINGVSFVKLKRKVRDRFCSGPAPSNSMDYHALDEILAASPNDYPGIR